MSEAFISGDNRPIRVVKARGYVDDFPATLIAYVRSVDGHPLAVIEYPHVSGTGTTWDVVPQECVREPWGTYAECGCLAPCPDHSPRSVGEQDRAYWDDRYDDFSDAQLGEDNE